jgi:hypothetical protein
MYSIFIDDEEIKIKEPNPDDVLTLDKEELIRSLFKTLEYKYLKENYPIVLDKIYNTIYKDAEEKLVNSVVKVLENKNDGEVVYRYGMGLYSLCKSGAKISDENQRYFYFITGKFLVHIISFINAYIEANKKK